MAIPLAAPFIALRFVLPRLDQVALAARAVALLTCLHAAELRIASLSTIFEGVPADLMVTPLVVLPLGFAVQAWLKWKGGRTPPKAGIT